MLPLESSDPAHDRPRGSAWLILAADGSPNALGNPGAEIVAVDSDERFVRVLLGERPRVAIVSVPPAGPDALATAAVERSRRPALRLVLLNDPVDVAGRLHALEQGFDVALPSTIAAHELAGRISWLLARPRLRPTGRLSVAVDTELDPVAHRIRRGGQEVHLRPKESAACPARDAPRPRLQPARAHRSRLGPGLRRRSPHRRRPRALDPLEDRNGYGPPGQPRHGPRHGLPARPAGPLRRHDGPPGAPPVLIEP